MSFISQRGGLQGWSGKLVGCLRVTSKCVRAARRKSFTHFLSTHVAVDREGKSKKQKKKKMEIDEKLKGKRDELLFNFRDKRTKRCPNSICLHAAAAGNGSGSRQRHVYVINAAKHLNLTLLHLPMNMSTKSAEHTRSPQQSRAEQRRLL